MSFLFGSKRSFASIWMLALAGGAAVTGYRPSVHRPSAQSFTLATGANAVTASSSQSARVQRLSFVPTSIGRGCGVPAFQGATTTTRRWSASHDDDLDAAEEGHKKSGQSSDDVPDMTVDLEIMQRLWRSLHDRQTEVEQSAQRRSRQWRQAACQSGVSLVLPDWVRRLDVDYPLAVCGSASDVVYLAHLETGAVLASTAVHLSTHTPLLSHSAITEARVEHVIHQLFGRWDGGGTLAVAVRGTVVVEARRTGGVHVWRIVSDADDQARSVSLVAQGFMPSLQDCLVTAVRLQDDYLWVGTDDGSVEAYALDESKLPLTLRTQPDLSWNAGSSSAGSSSSRVVVMSLDICPPLGCVVAATDAGSVELLSFEDDDDDEAQRHMMIRKPIGSFTPQFDGTERRAHNVYPTCAAFCVTSTSSSSAAPGYSIACGANDGSIFIHPLTLNRDGEIDVDRAFLTPRHTESPPPPRVRQLLPSHFATVKCLASPAPGLLLTGGLDGTVRLWDIDAHKFLYQFVGYKVWLGSLWTDGERIITDGADNTVIVHDFTKQDDKSKDDERRDSSRKPDQAEDSDV